jgi:hypothetical protein
MVFVEPWFAGARNAGADLHVPGFRGVRLSILCVHAAVGFERREVSERGTCGALSVGESQSIPITWGRCPMIHNVPYRRT